MSKKQGHDTPDITDTSDPTGLPPEPPPTPLWQRRLQRLAIAITVPAIGLLVLFLVLWNVFFHYVPPKKMLVVISKSGSELPAGQLLADAGQKGPVREVLGEGWHFITPILYTTELKDVVEIPPGQLGIVNNLGGDQPDHGGILVDGDKDKGIRRQVLLPGTYRINPYGYKVDIVKASEVHAGFVGVVRRLQPRPPTDTTEEKQLEKDGRQTGFLADVLQPGMYYLNTREFEVTEREVGIYQTSYHYDRNNPARNTAITFRNKESYTLNIDMTVEWELLPKDAGGLSMVYANLGVIESNVIDQQAKKIAQDLGFNYSVEDWLDGSKREKYQEHFRTKLKEECGKLFVQVNSAFIRNIIIDPDDYLKNKRQQQVEIETRTTLEIQKETALTDAKVQTAQKLVDQSVVKVEADTEAQVALIQQQKKNLENKTDAEMEKLRKKFEAEIGQIDAEKNLILGEAKAEAELRVKTAKSAIYKMKMEVFKNDGDAFLKYTLAQSLNPNLNVRLFHAGPGTFWTNLEGGFKNMSLLLPAGGANGRTPEPMPEKPPVKP
jgi:hypothetical protein